MREDGWKVALLLTRGVSPSHWVRLGAAHPGARMVSPAGLAEVAARTGRPAGPVDWEAVARQQSVLARCGARAVSIWDDDYPALLREIPDPPPVLFVRGELGLAAGPAAAIVGTRKPTPAGTAFATRLAGSLARMGVTVVSGLARGIDTAAHRGALAANGPTIAVLGTGIDVVYPPENGSLTEQVASAGCMVSEQLCGTAAHAHVFPRRNRIISGLCDGVVVVEGGIKSGALITARWALDQGREVGAVPGFPGDFRSAGPNHLLREGAFVVEDAVDVVANLPGLARSLAAAIAAERAHGAEDRSSGLDGDAARVYDLVAHGATPDEVARASGLDVARAQEILVRLEIDGHLVRDDLNRFFRAGGGERPAASKT
jgi:DNA processing protein